MSELHIRINKRTFERIIFVLIIAVLGGLLFFGQPASTVDSEQVTSLQSQVDNLSATNDDLRSQISDLESQVTDLQTENANLQGQLNATQESSTDGSDGQSDSQQSDEQELSGEVDVTWDVAMDGDELSRVTIVLENGLESTQELTYEVVWNEATYRSNNVNSRDTVTVSSGDRETVIIQDYISNPGEDIDTLLLEVTNEDGETVFDDDKQVR